jgi:hypothetical protein
MCVYIYISTLDAQKRPARRGAGPPYQRKTKKNDKYIYIYIYSRRVEETCASRQRASISGVAAARQKSVTDPPHTHKKRGGQTRDLRLTAEGLHIRGKQKKNEKYIDIYIYETCASRRRASISGAAAAIASAHLVLIARASRCVSFS